MAEFGPWQEPDTDRTDVLISQDVIPYLRALGYDHVRAHVPVRVGSRQRKADLVAYLDEEGTKPYLIAEAKQSLPSELTILDTVVRQAFALMVSLGDNVGYLLVTDGRKHVWFKRRSDGRSLVPVDGAPPPPSPARGTTHVAAMDPDEYIRLVLTMIEVLRRNGVETGIRLSLALNQVLIAKLYAERQVVASDYPPDMALYGLLASVRLEEVAERVSVLYQDALRAAGLEAVGLPGALERLPARAVRTLIDILGPYPLSSVPASIRVQAPLQALGESSFKDVKTYATPKLVADLLCQLANPKPGEHVIDPACGVGLLLIEARHRVVAQPMDDRSTEDVFVGIEVNADVAELAATNVVLGDAFHTRIVRANALDRWELGRWNVELGQFDVALLDPPLGRLSVDADRYMLRSYENVALTSNASAAVLLIEQAINLLRPGGRLTVLIPDSVLISPAYRRFRDWMLTSTQLRAVVSLPPETFAPAGTLIKTSVLLLQKGVGLASRDVEPASEDEDVLVADVQAIGYDRAGRQTDRDDMPALAEAIDLFRDGQRASSEPNQYPRIWLVPARELSAERLDATHLDPLRDDVIDTLQHGRYPTAPLGDLADVLAGRNVRDYVAAGSGPAIVIPAGSVRDLSLDLSEARFASADEYSKAGRARIQAGDILVTTTGQYLGRAALVDASVGPAIASGAVTIVRVRDPARVNPLFLAAIISSDLGKRQIAQRQAATTAQPYIRRPDLAEILIPLPETVVQGEIASRIRDTLVQADALFRRAQDLESTARTLLTAELLGSDTDE